MKRLFVLAISAGLVWVSAAAQEAAEQPAQTQQPQQRVETTEYVELQETMPEYPGGDEAMYEFLQQNIRYPKDYKTDDVERRTLCQVVIDKEGNITNARVLRSSGMESLDQEALRVIQLMPKWKPATRMGKPVLMKYMFAVRFH
ncbi:MAG: energy transducer TonB [Paludibacteraceae bacterium]|nr:energy transducer TonB [Paludibacteraceae bacterium]